MTNEERVKLTIWMHTNKDMVENEAWTASKVTDHITKNLGIDATPAQIRYIAKGLDFNWHKGRGDAGTNSDLEQNTKAIKALTAVIKKYLETE